MRASSLRKEPTEKQFQAQVVALAKLHGWFVYHTFDSRRCEPGFPDLVLVRGSLVLWAELKVGKNKVSAAQEEWLSRLRAAGQHVRVWRPGDWAEIEETLR